MINIIYFILGIIAYSFTEYAVHRWILHGPMIKQHWEHHRDPVKHTQVPLKILIPALFTVWVLIGLPLMFGMLACWIWSGAFHRKLHTGKPTSPWETKLLAHHNGHHRKVATNYGVTSRIWDRLFGTLN